VYDRDEHDGLRTLIMRRWPRGIPKGQVDVWLKDAAPSVDLLDAYRRGLVGWGEFEQWYRAEISKERPAVLDEIRDLERQHGKVRLLCFERIPPQAHCHRLVLLELLRTLRSVR
jgi:uncharacterized protein YeaO (DUF488 family)